MTDLEKGPDSVQAEDINTQIAHRKAKLAAMREDGEAYPNDFERQHLASDLHEAYGELTKEALEGQGIKVVIAGRMMTRRIMGKASFVNCQDMSGTMQCYIARDLLSEGVYPSFKSWDLGDIIGVSGVLFKTKTGELSVKATEVRLLTKSLRPLPDKFHGLTDQEQRFRQRYLDLMTNERTREIFQTRIKVVRALRDFLDARGFLEVETPMMHAEPGGATAKPFMTHHNALDMTLYLRVAPELHLKRLVVGGFEKVYEINRNFRNEGLSTRHNPEFTMVEFYQAYANYHDLMNMTETLFREIAETLFGNLQLHTQGHDIDLSQPFQRASIHDLILSHNAGISASELNDLQSAKKIAKRYHIDLPETAGLGRVWMELFEETVEKQLIQPTFVTEFPTEVSPLAKANVDNPFITDRFELYCCGQEIANGFSELNDPEDQAARFEQQLAAKAAGDEEAMSYDDDYITALEYGLPPTAGEGIGIDRLVMLFANCKSIKEVILFPQMRPKKDP